MNKVRVVRVVTYLIERNGTRHVLHEHTCMLVVNAWISQPDHHVKLPTTSRRVFERRIKYICIFFCGKCFRESGYNIHWEPNLKLTHAHPGAGAGWMNYECRGKCSKIGLTRARGVGGVKGTDWGHPNVKQPRTRSSTINLKGGILNLGILIWP